MASHSGGVGSGGGGSASGYESPMVRQELAKLDKGGEKRRSALASLRACVEKLDASSVPRFLSQVGDARDLSVSRPHAISLYTDVARVHGRLIAPEIPRIMITITRTLSSSGSSIHLHESCARVVAALLRYAISPLSAMADADKVFPDVCNPLIDVLSAKIEPLAAGAAICLQAAVESEKWKYAPRDLVADLCARASAVLRDRSGQTVGHIQLARSLVRVGAVAPDCGVALLRASTEILRGNPPAWQQKASALQLVRALLLGLDKKSLAEESESIGKIIEHIRRDRMPHVRSEAVKALQALKAQQVSFSSDDANGNSIHLAEAGMDSLSRSSSRSSRSFLWEQHREELCSAAASTSQESQLVSLSPPPTSPESSSPVSRSRRRRRYPLLPPAQRTGSSGSSSIATSEDASDSFATFEAPGLESKENGQMEEGLQLDDQCAASSESCVIDDSEEVVVGNFFGEVDVTATARSTNGRYALVDQSPASTVTTANGDDVAKFSNNVAATPERSASILTAEDFTKYTTPRRLVRSLQALESSPDSDPDEKLDDSVLIDGEAEEEEESSEAAWSVRDNPIAEQDLFDDRHRFHLQQPQKHGECDDPLFRDEEDQTENTPLSPPQSSTKAIKPVVTKSKKKRTWKIARGWIEWLLGGLLVVVLLLPLAMVVLMLGFSTQDVGLVPT
ncbi:uncharacterized protein LOC112340540 [Selaginella moellendorffii]|uniref:uncharacterized protein LOC112340540 n=1 Tax=Selaginella moellendorffii TaxID=88036 RepID=UPI000D1D01B6|nr:uncharacterized protein LOC112340540 [Selaginella moellendorffii]|eukprot:XP_024514891.1 uncharacterized protein LOC112340540 [Selaginella moellendorffii]